MFTTEILILILSFNDFKRPSLLVFVDFAVLDSNLLLICLKLYGDIVENIKLPFLDFRPRVSQKYFVTTSLHLSIHIGRHIYYTVFGVHEHESNTKLVVVDVVR